MSDLEAQPRLQFFVGNLCKTVPRDVIYDALKSQVYVQTLDLPKARVTDSKYKHGDLNRGYAVVSCKNVREARRMISKGSIVIAGDRAIIKRIDMVKKNVHLENRRTRHSTRVTSPVNSSSSGFDYNKFVNEVEEHSRHDSGVNSTGHSTSNSTSSPIPEDKPAQQQTQMQTLQSQLPTRLEDEIARRREKCQNGMQDLMIGQHSTIDSNNKLAQALPIHENSYQNTAAARTYVNALNDACLLIEPNFLAYYCEYVKRFTALYKASSSSQEFVGYFGEVLQGSFNVDESAYAKECKLLYNCC